MKRIIALFCLCLLCLLTSCSSKQAAESSKATPVEENVASSETSETDGKEPVNLIWWTYDADFKKDDLAEIMQKANEISAEKIGVTVDLKYKNDEQLSLDLNTGEYYDMIFSCSWCNDFDGNARKGYYYDLTDIVKEKTPELYAAVDPWWDPATVDGRIYGVPELKDLGAEVFFILNQDFFEDEKGMTIPEEMKFDDLEEYLKAYKEAYPEEYPLFLENYGILGFYQVHERILGKYLVIPYRYAGTDKGTKIIPFWEDDEFMGMLRTIHKWYEAGYINPDAATYAEGVKPGTPVKSITAWTGYKPASDGSFERKLSRYIGPVMSRATMQGANIAINAAADEEHVTAALKYMELLYTDREFRDLLAYGIEGEHFNYYNGTVIRTEKGIDNYFLDYYCTGPAVSASPASTTEDDPADPDMWEKVYKEYEHALISDTNGFSFDSSAVEAECTALNEYVNTYWSELITGTVDPDAKIAEMKEQMNGMGLEKVMNEAQRQLDEYLGSLK